jgi:hypothetical protein
MSSGPDPVRRVHFRTSCYGCGRAMGSSWHRAYVQTPNGHRYDWNYYIEYNGIRLATPVWASPPGNVPGPAPSVTTAGCKPQLAVMAGEPSSLARAGWRDR